MKTVRLFVATALAEIVGCYLPYLWLVKGYTPTRWDVAGVAFSLVGMSLIAFQPR